MPEVEPEPERRADHHAKYQWEQGEHRAQDETIEESLADDVMQGYRQRPGGAR